MCSDVALVFWAVVMVGFPSGTAEEQQIIKHIRLLTTNKFVTATEVYKNCYKAVSVNVDVCLLGCSFV